MQLVEFSAQSLHWTLGKIHLHLGFLQPMILEEDDDMGMKVDIFAGVTPTKSHELQA